MAAYGGQEAIAALGNQIYVVIKKGSEPARVVELRVKYEQTIEQLRHALESTSAVPVDKQQLFFRGKELDNHDTKTLLDLNIHTGFSLHCYDLTVPPVYWPHVKRNAKGKLCTVRGNATEGHVHGYVPAVIAE